MLLAPFFTESHDLVEITPQQASRFAKDIACDFNPIHDEDAKRFCVPGDLLFALVLHKVGLSQAMHFRFEGMVGKGVKLRIPQGQDKLLALKDSDDKQYLNVCRSGNRIDDQETIDAFIRQYVAFSGMNFTHVLVPLMREHQVMINPARPLVIYDSMGFELSRLDIQNPRLQLADSKLQIEGKRGDVSLYFDLFDGEESIGTGKKTLVLSSLRPYEEDAVQGLCDLYEQRKAELA